MVLNENRKAALQMHSYSSCRARCCPYLYVAFLLHKKHTLNAVESRQLITCSCVITQKVQYQWSKGDAVCAWLEL